MDEFGRILYGVACKELGIKAGLGFFGDVDEVDSILSRENTISHSHSHSHQGRARTSLSSHFSSSVTHRVSYGASSIRYFSVCGTGALLLGVLPSSGVCSYVTAAAEVDWMAAPSARTAWSFMVVSED